MSNIYDNLKKYVHMLKIHVFKFKKEVIMSLWCHVCTLNNNIKWTYHVYYQTKYRACRIVSPFHIIANRLHPIMNTIVLWVNRIHVESMFSNCYHIIIYYVFVTGLEITAVVCFAWTNANFIFSLSTFSYYNSWN